MVKALVDAGADVDKQDRNQWNALMWAMTNRHKGIAKILLDNGASPDAKTSSGRTAFDFIAPDSDMSYYLSNNGYNIGNAGVDDFYQPGFEDQIEAELAESELRRRMMMDSARDLEVDLGNVGMDDQPEVGLLATCPMGDCYTCTNHECRTRTNSKRKKHKNSIGVAASMTKCLSFRKTSLTDYWISSLRICNRKDLHRRSQFRQT